jgi:hypothetical protein
VDSQQECVEKSVGRKMFWCFVCKAYILIRGQVFASFCAKDWLFFGAMRQNILLKVKSPKKVWLLSLLHCFMINTFAP